MASHLDGSTALSGAFTPVTAAPLTLAAWVYPTALTSSHDLIVLLDVTASAVNAFRLNLSPTAGVRAIQRASNVTAITATSALPVVGRWQLVAAVFASNASRTAYLDNAASATDTTTLTPNAVPTTTLIGRYDNAFPNPFVGAVAFPSIWNAALTPAEIQALAGGTPPTSIRPDALAESWPLRSFEPRAATGLRRGLRLTATAAPVAWMPDPRRLIAPTPPTLSYLQHAAEAPVWHPPDWIGRIVAISGSPPPPRPKRWFPGLSSQRRRA